MFYYIQQCPTMSPFPTFNLGVDVTLILMLVLVSSFLRIIVLRTPMALYPHVAPFLKMQWVEYINKVVSNPKQKSGLMLGGKHVVFKRGFFI